MSSSEDSLSNVVYLGRIPHGFYEDEMRAYFSQFGSVLNLRMSRNKKFETPEIASIVAETMDQYMMFYSLLQCKVLPESKIHPQLWKGANRKFKVVPFEKKSKSTEVSESRKTRLLSLERKKRKKIAATGIDYDFPGYSALIEKQ